MVFPAYVHFFDNLDAAYVKLLIATVYVEVQYKIIWLLLSIKITYLRRLPHLKPKHALDTFRKGRHISG